MNVLHFFNYIRCTGIENIMRAEAACTTREAFSFFLTSFVYRRYTTLSRTAIPVVVFLCISIWLKDMTQRIKIICTTQRTDSVGKVAVAVGDLRAGGVGYMKHTKGSERVHVRRYIRRSDLKSTPHNKLLYWLSLVAIHTRQHLSAFWSAFFFRWEWGTQSCSTAGELFAQSNVLIDSQCISTMLDPFQPFPTNIARPWLEFPCLGVLISDVCSFTVQTLQSKTQVTRHLS